MAQGSRKRRYLASIYLWIGLAMALMLALFALLSVSAVRGTVRDSLLESDRKLFAQIRYQIVTMDTILRNLDKGIFTSADAGYLMYAPDPDVFEATIRLARMKRSILSVYPFVHSFHVYNRKADLLYSSYSGMYTPDAFLQDLVRSGAPIPILVPLYRLYDNQSLNPATRYDRVFTYAIHDSGVGDETPQGAVFLNIREEWVLDTLRQIEGVAPESGERTLLLDAAGALLIDTGRSASDPPAWETDALDALRPLLATGSGDESIQLEIGGASHLANIAHIDGPEWTVARLRPTRTAFGRLDRIRGILLLLAAGVLLLALVMAYAVSIRIYRPVGRLVRQVQGRSPAWDAGNATDEIEYLSTAFSQALDQARASVREKETNRSILRQFRFRQLLADSRALAPEDLSDEDGQSSFAFRPDRTVQVLLFRIDDARDFRERFSVEDQELYRFLLCNIARDVLADMGPADVLPVDGETAVAVYNPRADLPLDPLLERIQQAMVAYFQIRVSVAASRTGEDYRDVSALLEEVRRRIEQRLFLGRSARIHPEEGGDGGDDRASEYPAALDRRLADAIRRQDPKAIDRTLESIVAAIRQGSVEAAGFSISRLLGVVRSTVQEMNRDRLQPLVADFVPLQRRLSSLETLEEIRADVSEFLRQLLASGSGRTESRNRVISDTILDIIARNHADPNLSLQSIAAMMRMSADYAGRLFREDRGLSVAEAINLHRIEKAAEWLRNSDLDVRQVMARVGIESESHFYRQFKSRFGVTPREYAGTAGRKA